MSGSSVLFGSPNSLVLAASVSSGWRGSFDSDGSFVLTFLVLLSGSSVSRGSSRLLDIMIVLVRLVLLVIVLVLVLMAFMVFVVLLV